MDEAGQFMEVRQTAANDTVSSAILARAQASPRFRTDRLALATALLQGRDWSGAAVEFRTLAIAYPDSSGFAFDAATAYMQAGDSVMSVQWLREAAKRPDAPPEVVEAAKKLEPEPTHRPAKRPKRRGRAHTGGA
jgi:hypothetical protein